MADNAPPQSNHEGVDLGQPPPPPPPMPQGDDMEVVNEEENSQDSNSNSMYTGGNTDAVYSMYLTSIFFLL